MDLRAYRAAMAAGIAFPILLFIGSTMTVVSSPDTSKIKTAEGVAKAYAALFSDAGDRLQIIIGSFVLMTAALALLWFASALSGRLARPGSPMMAFATVAAVGVAAALAGPLALAGGITFGGEPAYVDGNAARAVFGFAFPCLLVIFSLASAGFIATVCLSAWRAGWPRWLVYLGWAAVVAGALGVLFMPIIVVLAWYLAVGVVGLVHADEVEGVVA